jgi:DNA-binding transcriptional MocR family regulator
MQWLRLLGVADAGEVLPAMRGAAVVALPGRVGHPRTHDPGFACPFLRVSFAYVSSEEAAEGVRRLGGVLRRRRAQQAEAQAQAQQQQRGGPGEEG